MTHGSKRDLYRRVAEAVDGYVARVRQAPTPDDLARAKAWGETHLLFETPKRDAEWCRREYLAARERLGLEPKRRR